MPETWLEILMRFTPASIALAVLLTTVSSVGLTQRPDTQIEPRSIEWQKAGEAARKAGNLGLQTDGRPTKKQRRQIHQFREYVHPFDD